jgi:transcriptional regulator with XRE-family HTH domain
VDNGGDKNYLMSSLASDARCYKEVELTLFGNWLKEQRERMGITQEELAAKLDKSQSWISQVETGRNVPSAEEAAALAYFLKGNGRYVLALLDEPPWVGRLEERLAEVERHIQEIERKLR